MNTVRGSLVAALSVLLPAVLAFGAQAVTVGIQGANITLDGAPAYEAIEGSNAAVFGLVFGMYAGNAIVDDANPETRGKWAYPDTGQWDPERNTAELIAMLPAYKSKGVLAVSVNFQGAAPSLTNEPAWRPSGFNPDGSMKPDYLSRLDRLIRGADANGMFVTLGFLNPDQDQVLTDEAAVVRAVGGLAGWLADKGHKNVVIDVVESCDTGYDHAMAKPARVVELVRLAREASKGLPVSASFSGAKGIPTPDVLKEADLVLLCSSGPKLKSNIDKVGEALGGIAKPVFNIRDGHSPSQLFTAAENYTSWGYFDQGANDYQEGWASLPVNWAINTQRKKDFIGSTLFWVWAGEREE